MNHIQFSKEELARYNRHIIIPEFGLESQQKLKAAKVLVVGSVAWEARSYYISPQQESEQSAL